MKKIFLFILFSTCFIHIELSLAQDMDEFDLQAIGGFDDNCDCGEENYRFGISDFNTVNYNIAVGINNFVFQNWVNIQKLNIENRIENLTDKEFSSFREASIEVVKDNVTYQGAYWKNRLDADDYPKYYDSRQNKKLNLIELQHLQIRRDEIQSGNINNSVFSFSKVNGRFLKDIKNISDLNASQNTIRDYYEVNSETEFIASNFRSKISRFDRLGFGSYMKDKVQNYWDKDLKNSFWDKLFGRTNNEIFDRLYLSQFYTNMFMLYPPNYFSQLNDLEANEYISYENSDIAVIKDMPKGRSGNILGFVWGDMPDFDFNFEELLNSFSEEDILSDLKIVGLGQNNNDFLNTRLDLRTEIAEYFKENDLSQVSHDAINYLLNEYRAGRNFVVDYSLFDTNQPSIFSDASNLEQALEFCFDSNAKDHGLPNFGNVLSSFFDYVEDDDFECYIIRNIFDNRGIDVPSQSELSNSWYGENFKFVAQVNGCIKINFDDESKTDGFLPNWFLDKDNDGYHAKGIAPKKQANSAGTGWVEGVSKGEDCDDTNPNKKDKGDCFNLNDPCANKDLRNKKVSDKVKREEIESRVHNILQAPGTRIDIPEFGIQEIEDGRGDINADKYELDITKLPNGVTAQQLFEDIRKNFFTLVTGGNNLLEKATFMGYAPEDFNSWNSSNPIGSAMDFDTLLDTATVIATEYSLQEMFWTFTTVTSKDHFGHPVSGHRQFRLRANPDGSHTFVVRGSDRLSTLLDYSVNSVGDDFAFDLADNTWKNLMKSIEGFIKAKPGGEVKPFDKSKQYGIRHKYNENDCK